MIASRVRRLVVFRWVLIGEHERLSEEVLLRDLRQRRCQLSVGQQNLARVYYTVVIRML